MLGGDHAGTEGRPPEEDRDEEVDRRERHGPIISDLESAGPREEPIVESWRNRKTLILGRTDMMGLLTPSEYNDCVEHAFRMHGLGRVYMEPKGHIVLDRYQGEWEVMPS